jgi:hypothetical protein
VCTKPRCGLNTSTTEDLPPPLLPLPLSPLQLPHRSPVPLPPLGPLLSPSHTPPPPSTRGLIPALFRLTELSGSSWTEWCNEWSLPLLATSPPPLFSPPVPRLPGVVNGPAVLALPHDVLSEFGQSPPMSPSPVATQPPVHLASPAPPPPTEEEEEAVVELRRLYEVLVAQTTYIDPIWISSSLI